MSEHYCEPPQVPGWFESHEPWTCPVCGQRWCYESDEGHDDTDTWDNSHWVKDSAPNGGHDEYPA